MIIREIAHQEFEFSEEETKTIKSAIAVLWELLTQLDRYNCENVYGEDYSGDIVIHESEISDTVNVLDDLLKATELG